MSKYLVEIPIVGYVSVVVEADSLEEAFDKGFELASECQYKTNGQEATLVIEELEAVDDLNEHLNNIFLGGTSLTKAEVSKL